MNGACILIVEDEPLIAMDLADHVEDAGGQVAGPFYKVQTAWKYLQSHQVVGAILDANLQDGNIDELAKHLCQHVPVVFYTGRGIPEALRSFCDVATVISKPASTARVVSVLAEAIEASGGLPPHGTPVAK